MKFDYYELCEMAAECSCCEDVDAIAKRLADDASFILESLADDYLNNEVQRVINSFQNCSFEDFGNVTCYNPDNVKAVKGIKTPDIAYIAAQVGFIAGILYAENQRFNFFKGDANIE